jgi:hypothetical protein
MLMFSYYVFALGILVGVGAALLVREISNAQLAYKDRKQAEFEAAVQAAAAHRKAQADRDWDAVLKDVGDRGWSHVEPTDNPRHPSNVRRFAFDKTDDPFADV